MSKKKQTHWSTKHERAVLRRKIRQQLYPNSQTAAVLQHIGDMAHQLNRPCRYASFAEGQYARREVGYWAQYRKEIQALERLRKARFVQVEKRKDGYYVALSGGGEIELVKQRVYHGTKLLQQGWICLVVFDIPEQVKEIREDFRRLMKRCGFTMLQQSVWMSSRDVEQDMRQLVHLLGVEKWIKVFVGRDLP